MPQANALKDAVKRLVLSYVQKVSQFNVDEFLSAGVDPFRFTFNVSVWGLNRAIQKEIEHKMEMALENYIGDFHEHYLGNTIRQPSGTKWRKVPNGTIGGIDIANDEEQIFLQVKSKHNSMNSSSSARLAQELGALKKKMPNATVGCAWVVAKQGSSCTGEKLIAQAGITIKGKKVYEYVTGTPREMDMVLKMLPSIVAEVAKEAKLESHFDRVAVSIANDLKSKASASGMDITEYILGKSID